MARTSPPILTETVTITKAAGLGYSTIAEFGKLGDEGRVLRVVAIEDATLDKATAGVLFLAPQAVIDATTTDAEKTYESDPITFAGSATVASLDENVANIGGAYWRGGTLRVAVNVTAEGASSSTSIEVTVTSERIQ